jgi:hypothetical protein
MDASKKRRLTGAAAFSVTALVTVLGAAPAGADTPAPPPGLARACAAQEAHKPDTTALGSQGLDCSTPPDGGLYNWWKKT